MTWETDRSRDDDPCVTQYGRLDQTDREIHANLSLRHVRIYTRQGQRVETFGPIISGPVTVEMARNAGWCHMHPIAVKLDGPTGHGLLNFVVFCLRRQIGFHSDMWMQNGRLERIPGAQSAGCIRIPHAQSRVFFDGVRNGDCVRVYAQQFWRPPTFARSQTHATCARR